MTSPAPGPEKGSEIAPTLATVAGFWALRPTPQPKSTRLALLIAMLVVIGAKWLRPAVARMPARIPALVLGAIALAGAALIGEAWPVALAVAAVLFHRRVVSQSALDDRITVAVAAALLVYAGTRAGFVGPLIVSTSIFVPAALSVLSAGTRFRVRPLVAVGLGLAMFASGAALYFHRLRHVPELTVVTRDLFRPTDVQFPPGVNDRAVVLGQDGDAWVVRVESGMKKTWFHSNVHAELECGLLGLAFHPRFPADGRFYVNQCVRRDNKTFSQIVEWTAPNALILPPVPGRVILELEQPWDNHNGGQLRFGKDGFLYVGFGDGGSVGDPENYGQNLQTWLGKMLRIDPTRPDGKKQYSVPPDNPFLKDPEALPEIWAYGLRNPWRFDFLPDGRLIVGDVGDESYEEVNIVSAGANLGWSLREGRHCFKPAENCRTEGLVDPIHEYGRGDGVSITGGVMYYGKAIPSLYGKFLFADFGRATLHAMTLDGVAEAIQPAQAVVTAFGRDARGEVYLVDYATGKLLRLDPPSRRSLSELWFRRSR